MGCYCVLQHTGHNTLDVENQDGTQVESRYLNVLILSYWIIMRHWFRMLFNFASGLHFPLNQSKLLPPYIFSFHSIQQFHLAHTDLLLSRKDAVISSHGANKSVLIRKKVACSLFFLRVEICFSLCHTEYRYYSIFCWISFFVSVRTLW